MKSDKKDIGNFVPRTGVELTGVNGVNLYNPGKNHFAPRFGFAYQANQKGDLVVRGSLGVFFDQINLNPFLDFRPIYAASHGIEGNAFGPSPISTYGSNFCGETSYQWDAIQVPGLVCPASTPNAGLVNTAGSIFALNPASRPPHSPPPSTPK